MYYEDDFMQIYSFWCSRYKDMRIEEFLNIGLTEFNYKISSIPEAEPLYNILKSRTINIESIKDKEERKYWRNQKRINKIPEEYISSEELNNNLKKMVGGKYGKGLNKIL